MELFERTFKVDRFFTLYPIGDLHYGSKQCDIEFVKNHIQRIKDDTNGFAVLMGDLTENNIVGSAGNVYEQIKSPHSQLNEVVSLLSPIQDKLLFGVESNHSSRTRRAVGLSIDHLVCDALKIPYGISVFAYFTARSNKRGSAYGYKCFFHHGATSGISKGSKVNAGSKLVEIASSAEAIFYGHTHLTSRIPSKFKDIVVSGDKKYLVDRLRFIYNTGSALTWDESYAEEKGYPPAAEEFISVDFYCPTSGTGRRQQVYRSYQP